MGNGKLGRCAVLERPRALDGMVETITARMAELILPLEQCMERLERRMERLEQRVGSIESRLAA